MRGGVFCCSGPGLRLIEGQRLDLLSIHFLCLASPPASCLFLAPHRGNGARRERGIELLDRLKTLSALNASNTLALSRVTKESLSSGDNYFGGQVSGCDWRNCWCRAASLKVGAISFVPSVSGG